MSRAPKPQLAIAEHFSLLDDPRVVGRSDHPLLTVLVMALVGVICGANGWDDIHDVAHDRRDWFARFLDMPKGVPSADTFRRVLSALRPNAFMECISSWVRSLAEPLDGQVVAFDGKTIRGALKRSPFGMLHQVHVWACAQRLLLGQTHVTGAPEEPDAVRRLLELIELKGAIVTGDAAHCSKATAQAILDAKGDYLLQLKANRAALHARVVEHFKKTELGSGNAVHAKTVEEAHGRRETREAWAVAASKVDLGAIEWPRLASITMIERTRELAGKRSVERHYYLSSLAPRARRLLDAARQHWRVENDLHWTLDVQFDEDACEVHDETGATNLGCLRRVALMMLKRETLHKRGLEAKRAKASRNLEYLERVMRLGIS